MDGGIPRNLGGSLRMNAGAMDAETFDQVVSVRYCDQDGNIFTRPPAEMEVHYRDVPTLQKKLRPLRNAAWNSGRHSANRGPNRMRAERKRRESQPIAASAGCIFKNPDQTPPEAIEELGFKNFTVGRARVSESTATSSLTMEVPPLRNSDPHRGDQGCGGARAQRCSRDRSADRRHARMNGILAGKKVAVLLGGPDRARGLAALRRRGCRAPLDALVEEVDVRDEASESRPMSTSPTT
jgi:hypothetical protein